MGYSVFVPCVNTEKAKEQAKNVAKMKYWQIENNRFIKRREKAQQRRRQGVYNMFARAYYDGDSDGMRRAIQRMTEYNRLYPQTPILLNNLMQSIRRRNKNRSTAYHGLTLNPKHRASLIREAERFGDPVFSF